jgi:diguanylate cyclase (GGDEF)-like protein/PAS domain S-box-containing protein
VGDTGSLTRPEIMSERYRLTRVIKDGGGVQTIFAESLDGGSPVIVKRTELSSLSASLGMRLEHEASVLGRLVGPGGEPYLVDHGTDDGWIWLAQRYWPGETLAKRLERGPLGCDETLAIARQVLSLLVVAHASGVIHRDVKPANIVVEDGRAGTATLIDFGLSRSVSLDAAVRDVPVGTARYCSPEQAGLIDRPLDERSDLYALGATLYECLSGAPLFAGDDVGAVLRQQLTEVVPDVGRVVRGVPRALGELIDRLLRKDPDERYQSAAAALSDVGAIESARRQGIADPAVVIGRNDRRSTLAEPGFVGRRAELAALTAQLQDTSRGQGGLVVIEGDSGGGKTRLLDELARQATEQGFVVLQGQAESRTAHRPFQIFDGLASGLADESRHDAILKGHVSEALAGVADTILAVAPRLSAVLPAAEPGELPEEYGQMRSVAALAELLDSVGRRERPALVILDDCQWAQGITTEVLSAWAASRRGERWTFVVAAYRSDEVEPASPLRSVEARGHIALSALGEPDIRDLISSMAGPVPAPAVRTVVRLSEGNAFMAQAVVRGMVESATLVRGDDGWELDRRALTDVQTSRQAALFLERRLDLLSAPAQELLQAAAVLGKEFDLDLAVALSGLPAAAAVPALDEVHRRRILWLDEGAGRGRFLHDRLREAVLDRLAPEKRAFLHLKAALRIEDEDGASPFEVAYHFDSAGRPDRAIRPALEAANRARSQHALDAAEFYFRIARKGATDDETRAMVADGLAEVLALAGRYAEAEECFVEASGFTSDERFQAALDGKLGEVAFRRGDQAVACRQLESAIRRLGHWVPKSSAGFLLGAIWELAVQAAHSLLPRALCARRGRMGERERLTMRFYSRLAYAYWFRSGRVPCLWAHLREMNGAERFEPSAELAQAYSEHAPVMTMLPWYTRGTEYARRSLELRRQLGDVWGQGQSLSFYGVVLYASSRYRESIAACQEAVRILEHTGDRWEMNTASWHIAMCHYRLGEWQQAAALAAEAYRSAERIGDGASSGISLSVWSRAGGLPPPEAIAEAKARQVEDRHTATEVFLAEAVQLLSAADPAAAARTLEEAWGGVRQAGLRQEYVTPVLPWWATALREQYDALPADDPARRTVLRRALKVARRARRLARSYRNNLPHALRELALANARRGRIGKARKLLERSVGEASSQGASWEQARGRQELGKLGVALGWAGAASELAIATSDLSRIEAGATSGVADEPATLSLADRFASLLEAGREIVAATSNTAVFEAVAEAARGLLRAERCHVLETDGGFEKRLVTVSGEHVEGISASAVREAIESGTVVCRTPSVTDDAADSLVLAGVRSLLCAPIHSGGRVVACFYATHKEVAGLFGSEEALLATFITTLAGAALEQVSGQAARFRALVEHSSDVTFLVDENARSSYVSPTATRILGYTPEEMLGDQGLARVHPDDLKASIAAFLKVVANPGSFGKVECRVLHKDGSWRWIEVSHTNRLHDPAVRSVVVNLHDTTERRLAEQNLARAAEQFRLAFDNAPIGVALVSQRPNNRGAFLLVNGALAEMLGTGRKDLEGKLMSELTHPDDLAADAEDGERFERGETDVSRTEKRYRHRNGAWIWVNQHSGLIRDDSGVPDYMITQVVDITQRRAAQEQLTHQALHDPLTGLPNRRLFLDRLDQGLARAKRRGGRVALLYLDLDRFKVINDSFGHATGDLVLIESARRLHALIRSSDTLARLGGDEFVLLVDDLVEPEEIGAIALRISEALSQPITVPPGVAVSVTTSIGIRIGYEHDAGSVLLRDADTALYRAKERGRACYEIFGENLRHKALGRMKSERDLRTAIDGGRLLLHFQPIVDLATVDVVAAESLLRYRSDDDRLVLPADFIDVAEETGLIVGIGTWVLREACSRLAELQAESGNPNLRVGVNVSPRQLVASSFPDTVATIIAESGVSPSSIALEITEAALIDSIEAIRPSLEQLREVGCSVGIDDFGTGYSSLAYLRRLPVDFLKVDKTFVRGLGTNREDDAIVKTVIDLAGALGLQSIAEGVETAEQEAILRGLGCVLAQGYRFGRPGEGLRGRDSNSQPNG